MIQGAVRVSRQDTTIRNKRDETGDRICIEYLW